MGGAIRVGRVCGALLSALDAATLTVSLHSRFRGAANLSTPLGLVTLLSPGRCLQPYAAVLAEDFDYAALERGALSLGPAGLTVGGGAAVSLTGAVAVDLRLTAGPTPALSAAWAIRRFLASGPEDGLSTLALGRSEGPYAALVAPRLQIFRQAARQGDVAAAAAAAGRMAGCGPGLTPSSDDLLCGYMALLPPGGAWTGMAAAISAAAGGATNAISASLLSRAGEGYFSEDVLELLSCLRRGTQGQELTRALLRVASFGSSSGYDLLTGVYFGVIDACAIGGMSIE